MAAARALACVLLLAVPALAGCLAPEPSAPREAPDAPPDAGRLVAFAKLHTPEEIADLVAEIALLPGVLVREIGRSIQNRPLHEVVVGSGPHVLWTVGRHHGNEPTGAEAILLFLSILADPQARLPIDAPPILHDVLAHRELLLSRVTFVFVPVVNPDGAAAFRRGNANGVDLNRDYAAFSQPEPRAVRDAFWTHRPDTCLDLHNEGQSPQFDWDAFAPLALPESEIQEELLAAGWRTVYEVDAAGGFGGGPNENYRVGDDGVARQVVWPDAFHPGTHDMFCSLRGAPGWTPESAISRSTDADPSHAWGTRLHMVTVASAAFAAAGFYEGFASPWVGKLDGAIGALGSDHLVDVPARGTATFQVVWREDRAAEANLLPVRVEIEDPQGRVHEARPLMANAYTATVRFEDQSGGTYRVNVKGPPGLGYQVRAYLSPQQEPPVRALRTGAGVEIESAAGFPLALRVTDVADAGTPATGAQSVEWNGTITPRAGFLWSFELAPGERRVLAAPSEGNPGPFRWTAVDSEGRVATGVEAARSTA
ncbi:MAG TPA: DUF2817 domain-containing protein [Candidatus Thermoplasmatota archaeon]|nr:DUF2817 domain-containing protein [Candidatus Thermoplasmatota archaeon]